MRLQCAKCLCQAHAYQGSCASMPCVICMRCAWMLAFFSPFCFGKVACLGAVSTRSIDLVTRSQSRHRATRNLSLNATAQASKDRGGSHLVRSPCTSETHRLGLRAQGLSRPRSAGLWARTSEPVPSFLPILPRNVPGEERSLRLSTPR